MYNVTSFVPGLVASASSQQQHLAQGNSGSRTSESHEPKPNRATETEARISHEVRTYSEEHKSKPNVDVGALLAENRRLRELVKKYQGAIAEPEVQGKEIHKGTNSKESRYSGQTEKHRLLAPATDVSHGELTTHDTQRISKSSRKRGKLCIVVNCKRFVKSHNLCIRHGGGKRCQEVGCTKVSAN